MITLIGKSTTAIGFGLCGVNDIYEVEKNMKNENIVEIIQKSENEIIMIDELIYKEIKPMLKKINKIFIKIPNRYDDENPDKKSEIDDLIKDTLGITMKN